MHRAAIADAALPRRCNRCFDANRPHNVDGLGGDQTEF